MEFAQPLFKMGEKVVDKDNIIFTITAVKRLNSGTYLYYGTYRREKIHRSEKSLSLYKERDFAKVKMLYAYENIRTGKLEKFTKQKNENQYSRRVPEFDEKVITR